jgi:excinuclease ABC subunit A
VNWLISTNHCPTCKGTRLSEQARASLVDGINLAEATAKTLDELVAWAPRIESTLPPDMASMTRSVVAQLLPVSARRAGR